MTIAHSNIAAGLEHCFVRCGFAEPGVDMLRDASGVSLRTLYKYFPSREAMVVGALDHRHERYISFVEDGAPANGASSIEHLFQRVEEWMAGECGTGCLFLNALAAHPASTPVKRAVERHKGATRSLLSRRADRPDLANALFLLHEGATAAWPLLEGTAIRAARESALKLICGHVGR